MGRSARLRRPANRSPRRGRFPGEAAEKRGVRLPVAAGIFYPDQKRRLADWIDRLLEKGGGGAAGGRAVALVVPHGGLQWAGAVAGAVYGRIEPPQRLLMIGPSHGEMEPGVSIVDRGLWCTPLGEVPVDEGLARALKKTVPGLTSDPQRHADEHALEVQLPFLQRIGRLRRFVPMTVALQEQDSVEPIAEGIARAIRAESPEALLVVTTDLSRYEPEPQVRVQDAQVLEPILRLQEGALLREVKRLNHSMCGAAATAVGIVAAKRLGATGGSLVAYQTSAEVTGEEASSVGYAGVLIR